MNVLSEESRYFLYLIEQYALHKGINGKQALDLFEKQNLIEYIYGMYYTYHTERIENAIEDIDRKLAGVQFQQITQVPLLNALNQLQ